MKNAKLTKIVHTEKMKSLESSSNKSILLDKALDDEREKEGKRQKKLLI